MSESEASVLRKLMVLGSELGARLFRNQVGQYRLARPQCMPCQREGRVMRSGLCVGSSDLIGWMSVVIGPEHVGRTLAVFVGIEAKREDGGTLSDDQQLFLAALERAGAVAGVARSAQDLETIIAPWRAS